MKDKTIQDLYVYCKKLALIRPSEDSDITDTHQFIHQTISQHIWGYQLITRPFDKNGNGFCSIICYDKNGNILLVMSSNNTRPNCIKFVTYRPCGMSLEQVPQLPTFSLSASEYNSIIKLAKDGDKLYHMV